jgi:hypothetical protein
MTGTIYLPTLFDEDYEGYRNEVIQDHYGYFTSKEEIEAWIGLKEDLSGRYARYVQGQEQLQANAQKRFDAKVEAWDLLRAAGVDPGFFKPKRPESYTVDTFDAWKERQRPQWSYVEVEPSTEL